MEQFNYLDVYGIFLEPPMIKKTRHKWNHIRFKGDDGEYHISHSVCKVCGIKRKKRYPHPDLYQKEGENAIAVKPGSPIPECE